MSIIGQRVDSINTPALLLDLDKLDYNINKMARLIKSYSTNLRPHIKTHKSPAIAHKQISAGAIGVTCQKLGEAEIMIYSGIKDILITNQIVTTGKIRRLVNLAKESNIKVAVDNEKNVNELSYYAGEKGVKLGVLVEVDIGMGRCGVSPGRDTLILASHILRSDNLEFKGIMAYEGHTVFTESYSSREIQVKDAIGKVIDTLKLLRNNGIECEIVSCGGTGTFSITGKYAEVTEIEAGSYATMDGKYSTIEGVGNEFKQALTLLSTVISTPSKDRAILDVGLKGITSEFGLPQIKDMQGKLEIVSLSEEHANLKIGNLGVDLKIGDSLELIPQHGCTTINLHDFFYGIRSGIVETIWPIAARGKIA